MRLLNILCALVLLAAQFARADEPSVWELAANTIPRLSPESFGELPAEIREYLDERGCTIPQSPYPLYPHNVVQGNLNGSGNLDLALLCSVEQRSTILVFWDSSATNVSQVTGWSDDQDWLQTGPDGIEFSRVLAVASPEIITCYSVAYETELTFNPTHDGVDDAFQGKGSTVHYWNGEKWLTLQGAD